MPLHRQYVTAKDLVTDYTSSTKQPQSDLALKVEPNDNAKTRDEPHSSDGSRPKAESKGEVIKVPDQTGTKTDDVLPRRHVETSTTPKNSGFFVNLSDGSGKISTR